MQRMLLIVWAAGIGTGVFYVGGSGLPQPGDWLLLFASMCLIVMYPFRPEKSVFRIWSMGVLAVGWICAVNWGWVIWTGDMGLLIKPAYYLFNLVVVTAIVSAGARMPDKVAQYALYGLVFGAAVNLIVIVAQGEVTNRPLGTFNNPNQLGYYGVTVAMAGAAWGRYQRWSPTAVLAIIAGCLLAGMSMSFSALSATAFVLLLVVVWSVNIRKVRLRTLAGVAITVMVALVLIAGINSDALEGMIREGWASRLVRLEDKVRGAIVGRGYSRIIKYPQYIIVGAGEGAVYRFPGTGEVEIHSSLGTILFSYGVIGVGLTIGLCYQMYAAAGRAAILLLMPAAIYGATHQGLRFTPLWVVVAVVMMLSVCARSRAGMHAGPDVNEIRS